MINCPLIKSTKAWIWIWYLSKTWNRNLVNTFLFSRRGIMGPYRESTSIKTSKRKHDAHSLDLSLLARSPRSPATSRGRSRCSWVWSSWALRMARTGRRCSSARNRWVQTVPRCMACNEIACIWECHACIWEADDSCAWQGASMNLHCRTLRLDCGRSLQAAQCSRSLHATTTCRWQTQPTCTVPKSDCHAGEHCTPIALWLHSDNPVMPMPPIGRRTRTHGGAIFRRRCHRTHSMARSLTSCKEVTMKTRTSDWKMHKSARQPACTT